MMNVYELQKTSMKAIHGDPKKDFDVLYALMAIISSKVYKHKPNLLLINFLRKFCEDEKKLRNLNISVCGSLLINKSLFIEDDEHGLRGNIQRALVAVIEKSSHWREKIIKPNNFTDHELINYYMKYYTNVDMNNRYNTKHYSEEHNAWCNIIGLANITQNNLLEYGNQNPN